MFGVGSHGGDGMFSDSTASGVMPKAEPGVGKVEAGGGQTHAVPPPSAASGGVKVEEADEEL